MYTGINPVGGNFGNNTGITKNIACDTLTIHRYMNYTPLDTNRLGIIYRATENINRGVFIFIVILTYIIIGIWCYMAGLYNSKKTYMRYVPKVETSPNGYVYPDVTIYHEI